MASWYLSCANRLSGCRSRTARNGAALSKAPKGSATAAEIAAASWNSTCNSGDGWQAIGSAHQTRPANTTERRRRDIGIGDRGGTAEGHRPPRSSLRWMVTLERAQII